MSDTQEQPHITITSIEEVERWVNVLNRRSIRDSKYFLEMNAEMRNVKRTYRRAIAVNLAAMLLVVLVALVCVALS